MLVILLFMLALTTTFASHGTSMSRSAPLVAVKEGGESAPKTRPRAKSKKAKAAPASKTPGPRLDDTWLMEEPASDAKSSEADFEAPPSSRAGLFPPSPLKATPRPPVKEPLLPSRVATPSKHNSTMPPSEASASSSGRYPWSSGPLATVEKYSVVQFETADFYTYEAVYENGDPIPPGLPVPKFTPVTIGISRLGSAHGVSRVQWSTFDYSAISGHHFVGVPPTWVEFADGVTHVNVTVNVIPNSSFDGAIEFGLYIDQSSCDGCVIGKYLHTAHVKIIDTSAFPTDKLGAWVEAGDAKKIQAIDPFKLVTEFVKMCWNHPMAKTATIKTIMTHQV